MFEAFWPFSIMSDRQIAYVSAFNSWPYTLRVACGLWVRTKSSATLSMPPVPHAGSYNVAFAPGLDKMSSSSMNSRLTIRRITSRGVKCSPAVSLESSEKRRISSS